MAIWTWAQLVQCRCYGTYELQRNITPSLPFPSRRSPPYRAVYPLNQPIIRIGTRRSKIPVSYLGNGTYPRTSSSSFLSSPSSSFLSDTNTSAHISAASTGASHWRCPAGRDAIRVWQVGAVVLLSCLAQMLKTPACSRDVARSFHHLGMPLTSLTFAFDVT
jgi:hypothetical protein